MIVRSTVAFEILEAGQAMHTRASIAENCFLWALAEFILFNRVLGSSEEAYAMQVICMAYLTLFCQL